MGRILAKLLLVLICPVASGQSSNPQSPNIPPNTPLPPGESSSRQTAPSPSSPPDAPIPDPSTIPALPDNNQPAVKRKLEQLVPSCLDILWGFHTCWYSPPASPPKAKPSTAIVDEQEFAKDMDVGDFYLNERRNYSGAIMRFRDALDHKPNDPLATFKLAQSLEGNQQADEARETYAAYLKLAPNGSLANQAKKALERSQPKDAGKKIR